MNKKTLLAIAALILILFLGRCSPPPKPEPVPVYKSFVGCFIDGNPVFMGEIIGSMRVESTGVIEFYSVEMGTTIRLINAGCIEVNKGMQGVPANSPKQSPATGNEEDPLLVLI